jgi:hypothetical protein
VHSTINKVAAVPQQHVPFYLRVNQINLASDHVPDSLHVYGFKQVRAQATAADVLTYLINMVWKTEYVMGKVFLSVNPDNC